MHDAEISIDALLPTEGSVKRSTLVYFEPFYRQGRAGEIPRIYVIKHPTEARFLITDGHGRSHLAAKTHRQTIPATVLETIKDLVEIYDIPPYQSINEQANWNFQVNLEGYLADAQQVRDAGKKHVQDLSIDEDD